MALTRKALKSQKQKSEIQTFTYEGSSYISSVQEDAFSDDSEPLLIKHFLCGTYFPPLIKENTCGDSFFWHKISLWLFEGSKIMLFAKINAGEVQNGIKLHSKTMHSFLP